MKRIGNKKLIRDINISRILRLINERGQISRTDLSKETGLSLAAICKIIDNLIEMGLVYEAMEGRSTGGRKPVLLSINKEAFYVIGLKIAVNEITFVLTGIDANPVQKLVYPAPYPLSLENIILLIESGVRKIISLASVSLDRFLGVGIGVSGFVNFKEGVVVKSGILRWENVPLKSLLEERLGISIYIDNDVNTLAMAEKIFGVAQKYENFILVTIGRGVGSGIFINGELYRGAIGGGGEFGHIPVNSEGPVCECGNRGCLETYVADPFLVEKAKEGLKKGKESIIPNIVDDIEQISPEIILEAAKRGDKFSREIFSEAGEYLGRGLATLVNILNPELIILSGEGMRAEEFLIDSVIRSLKVHSFANLDKNVRIIPLKLEDETWAIGAAALAINKIFEVREENL
jgi:glucokinase-like ROK family protein